MMQVADSSPRSVPYSALPHAGGDPEDNEFGHHKDESSPLQEPDSHRWSRCHHKGIGVQD